jgi:3-deoxy-D-manno-octulosonate 8-phosphate phosphatase (KDO 8-P phosphatase)
MNQEPWLLRSAQEYAEEARTTLGQDLAATFGMVQAMVFDADGVLTPGHLIYGPDGEAFKEFHSRDGLGLVMARLAGIKLAVLTGRQSPIVARRAQELRFEAVRVGRYDKLAALSEILAELGCGFEVTLYMGDDLVDLPALSRVGAPVAVPEAPKEVRQHCCFVTDTAGGYGAVREVVDWVLKCRGLYTTALKKLAQQAW